MEIKEEFKQEEITMGDIRIICDEIVRQDKSTRKLFDKSKIKSKYGKDVADIQDEYDKAMASGNLDAVEKVLNKYSKVVERISKLNPNMEIQRLVENNEMKYKVRDTIQKGSVSKLSSMFSHAKNNAKEELNQRKQEEKAEKEREIKEKIYGDVDKSRYDKMIEENERKSREDFRQGMDRAYTMDKFKTELQGGVQEWNREAIEKYGDSDTGRAWSEMEKNPDKKRLDEINGDKSR